MKPVCSCNLEIGDTSDYLLLCHYFTLHLTDLMIRVRVKPICDNIESITDNSKITLLLYGDSRFEQNKNEIILQSSITYIKPKN